ncbi:hypothetical protein NKG94_16930 [Micromonospora sp. M12]
MIPATPVPGAGPALLPRTRGDPNYDFRYLPRGACSPRTRVIRPARVDAKILPCSRARG